MKTAEELNALKEEVETLSKKLAALSEDELNQVTGGNKFIPIVPMAEMMLRLTVDENGLLKPM